jgi:hypothetical protein
MSDDSPSIDFELKVLDIAMQAINDNDTVVLSHEDLKSIKSPVSDGDENGAFVLAWVWVSFVDTELDKDNEGESSAED